MIFFLSFLGVCAAATGVVFESRLLGALNASAHAVRDGGRGSAKRAALAAAPFPNHVLRHKVDRVWQELGVFGRGVKIGISSTGVEVRHDGLRGAYAGTQPDGSFEHDYNWFDAFGSAAPLDPRFVGTHITGTAVCPVDNVGVAPQAKFMACRAIDDLERDTVASQLACLSFFLEPVNVLGNDPQPELRPDVVFTQFSDSSVGNVLLDAILALRRAGVVVVTNAAPREDGTSICAKQVRAPSFYKEVVTIGALAADGTLLSTSAGGPILFEDGTINPAIIKPDAVAVGGDVVSAVFLNEQSLFFAAGGTPVSGAMTTGFVALIISANPALRRNVRAVEDILKHGATPMPSTGCSSAQPVPNNIFGAGQIDAFRSVQRARTYPYGGCPVEPSPTCRSGDLLAAKLSVQQTIAEAVDSAQALTFTARFRPGVVGRGDFGQPEQGAGEAFKLCIYDTVDDDSVQTDRSSLLSSGVKVPRGEQWSSNDRVHLFKGTALRNSAANDGVVSTLLNEQRGTISVRGRGANLPLARVRPSGRFYEQRSAVIVQVHVEQSGSCFGAEFAQEHTTINNVDEFKATINN